MNRISMERSLRELGASLDKSLAASSRLDLSAVAVYLGGESRMEDRGVK